MFLAGRQPALVVAAAAYPALAQRLERRGYERHEGPRIRRGRELEAWKRDIGAGRQIHVQALLARPTKRAPRSRKALRGARIELYAHTEPAGYGPRHLWAALTDRVSYQHGARILRADLDARAPRRAA